MLPQFLTIDWPAPIVLARTHAVTVHTFVGRGAFATRMDPVPPAYCSPPPIGAAAGVTPSSTVATIGSSALPFTTSRISRSVKPHSSCSRTRRREGASGNDERISSTHSRAGATGTRSGSGKYR